MARGAVEVLIVGAGPAGAALALALARLGREVLVVERSRFPRDKPCGDCLNPGAVAELERLGIAARLRAALAPQPLRGWYVEAPDGRAFRATFGKIADGSRIEGWAVRRRDFDAELVSQAVGAGARVSFGLHVIDVVRERGRAVGVVCREGASTGKIRARFIVAADGLRSVVQRRLGLRRRPPRLRKIALVGHLAGANGSGDIGELRVRGGRTCGYAPVPSGANITLVIPEVQAAAVARGGAFLREALEDFPEVRDRALAHGLESVLLVTGPFDCPVRRPWAPGALLVGDAAGYYDPFTGQGIHQALRSAAYAAATIERILRAPRREIFELRRYGARLWSELMPKRVVQRAIETVIAHPERMSRVIGALADGDAAARRLLQVTGDIRHPLTLLTPATWLQALAGTGIGHRS